MSRRIQSAKIGNEYSLMAAFLTRPQPLDRGRYSGRGCITMINLSLSAKIMTGLVLGILTGLFFGERVGFPGMAGQAFQLLLQMTVLPCIVIALIKGIGGLGDFTYQLFISPANPGNIIWDVGPALTFPTATDPLLGNEIFAAGPAGQCFELAADVYGSAGYPFKIARQNIPKCFDSPTGL